MGTPATKDDFFNELRYFLERTPTIGELELYWNRYLNQKEERDALTWIIKHVEEGDEFKS
jgi:hypothetical protein